MSGYDAFGRPQEEVSAKPAGVPGSALEPPDTFAWVRGQAITLRLPDRPEQQLTLKEILRPAGDYRIYALEADGETLYLMPTGDLEDPQGPGPDGPHALNIQRVLPPEALEFDGQRGAAAIKALREEIARRGCSRLDAVDVYLDGRALVAVYYGGDRSELEFFDPQGSDLIPVVYQDDVAKEGEIFYEFLPWVLVPEPAGGYSCQAAVGGVSLRDSQIMERNYSLVRAIRWAPVIVIVAIITYVLQHL